MTQCRRAFDTELLTKKNKIIDALVTVSMIPGTDMRVISILDVGGLKRVTRELSDLNNDL